MLRVVEQYSLTDVGRQRNANEDACFASEPVYAVADGMGGARAGEVAAKNAIDELAGLGGEEVVSEKDLAAAVELANKRIHDLSNKDESLAGMGTTVTAVSVGDVEVAIAHVGDSRAYRLRNGELDRLTHDHSLVDEMVRAGRLTPEEAEVHPQRSIITRALGPEPEVEVERMTYPARSGDVYLICSDGLTTMVPEDGIAAILRARSSLKQAGEELVRAANEAGGRDNVTVVLVRLGEEGESEADSQATMVAGDPDALRTEDVREAVAQASTREPEDAADATRVFDEEQKRSLRAASRPPTARQARPEAPALGHRRGRHARGGGGPGGLLGRQPPVLLRRHGRPRPGRALSRPALRASVRARPVGARVLDRSARALPARGQARQRARPPASRQR